MTSAPTLFTAFSPRWKELSDRYGNLCRAEDAAQAELNAASARLPHDAPVAPPPPAKVRPVAPPSAPALALLRDITIPPPPAQDAPRSGFSNPDAQLRFELVGRVAAIREAKALLLPVLQAVWTEESERLTAEKRDEYNEVAGRVIDALLALGSAWATHNDWLAAWAEAECAYFRPIALEGLRMSDPRAPHNPVRQMLTRAAENGHFDLSRIPDSWREVDPSAPPKASARKASLVR